MDLQFGLDTFGDVTVDGAGKPLTQAQVIRDVVAQGVLADSLGVDYFAIGEHHRPDFAVSAPDTVLAGLATATGRIRLGSAVVVLSSDDPIRVYERFATIDALSGGRAEPVLGRGSFIESFGLYGFDLADYEKLFEEKLEVFSLLREEGRVTWTGTYRTPLADVDVFPKTEGGRMRSWVAVGGSPQSVVRAAHRGFGLQLAIIGGPAQRFKPFADLYRRAVDEFGVTTEMPVAVHSPGHVAETDELAAEQLFPHFKAQRDRIGRERGWGAMGSDEFTNEIEHGALYVGSPETVAAKIAATVRELKVDQFDLKYANGPMPHSQLMKSIELYATRVVPLVREMLA
ncbi:LLM class flavin-dependent oxidoreductase [Propioniciclava sp. MC1683]|uniref:LLM class flavin-dependent oxidoreductase n=1 Tax=Propioniciclava sp. MC1683 TaxID=2760309 RepID=UPI00160437BA|nr:LLM class flavin-dependent oxidoreductase [Propioniciclava sp. MC1683]MBB1501404.1 LLM class flavin-dependent oxidoreductase [Propioniciclava sp. MC1683]